MRRYTERIDVTLSKELKARLKTRAEACGISLNALVREIVDWQIASDDFREWLASREASNLS